METKNTNNQLCWLTTGGIRNPSGLYTKIACRTLLADNTRGLTTTKQIKPRPVAFAAPHPSTPAYVKNVLTYISYTYMYICVCKTRRRRPSSTPKTHRILSWSFRGRQEGNKKRTTPTLHHHILSWTLRGRQGE